MFSEELGVALLARVDDVDMNIGAPTTTILFTVPTGFQMVVDRVIIKPAATGFTTLAANTDIDLGKTGAPTDYANAFDPSGLISEDLVLSIGPDALELPPIYDAAEVFQLVNNDTSAAGSLVDILVFGTLIVA
jgi:hypothetical protein